ncbi:MAG: hypothetical protein LBF61_03405, partial [Azoarcus sp.]|nr:hypothetical protein [Azoarcus sp.]
MNTFILALPGRGLSNALADRLFGALARGAALLTLASLFGIIISLVIGAWPAIREFGPGFLIHNA